METTTDVKNSAAPTTDVYKDEVTMAQALAALKSTKPKVLVQEQEMSTIVSATATIVTTVAPTPRAKGKAKMIEPEVSFKRKEQMRIYEEYARKLEAEEQEAARLSRAQQDEEANNSWDNLQAMMDADRKRKKHFAALRAQEKRSKPPTKTQMKSQMSTYLRHMGGYKQSHLKGMSFDKIKELFDREMTKVDENVEPAIDDYVALRKCIGIFPDDGDELNSKFINNMLSEWGRFVIAIKLNRGLRDSNYDQLAHSKELPLTKATTELRILQRQDVADAGLREHSSFGRREAIADDCDAFGSDMDEAPTAQTMFMANLLSADPVTDEAGPSYDLDILSEVQDYDHYQDVVCTHHEEHAMQDSVQLDRVVDSLAEYMSDSNMILYNQYVKDNKVPVVHSNVSSVPNDAFMMIYDDMVFSVATNSELNVARFTEMIVAHTAVEARCLELEVELAKLRNTSHHDNQEDLINCFSKHEVNHLNLQLKYQNLKDSFGNNPSTPDKDTPDFDSVFVIGKMQAFLQGKDNTVDSQITKLTKQVTNLQAQNNLFRVENDKIKQHYKELYDSIKITSAKHIEQVKPKVLARGKHAIDVEPIIPHLRNNRDAHLDYLRHLKESVEIIRDIVEEAKVVVQIILWYLDSGCSKHMTEDRPRLINFMKKFIGTVRFGNDHFGGIMSYGDYVIGDSVISRVYYVDGLGHNLFSVEQFCNSDLEVAFRKHSCYV
nr:integrase, catalytic region, zinc finger, CCHC-type, peptidase aspartic, catalytic [Tanacetum cinerariifolium]